MIRINECCHLVVEIQQRRSTGVDVIM